MNAPSNMNSATEEPRRCGPHSGKFCVSPFDFATVDVSGNLNLCCQGYMPLTVGNLNDASFEEVWNSPMAQEVRRSILDGSFKFCSKTCPYLLGDYDGKVFPTDALPGPEYRAIVEQQQVVMDRGPREMLSAYDATCNLSCPACRTEHIVARGDEFTQAEKLHQIVLDEGLEDTTLLYLSGQGDPFSSRLYRSFLINFDAGRFPRLRIALITNALLFTPKMWENIQNSQKALSFVRISCNAATAETFEKVQRGGKWSRFLENMKFVAQLRSQGKIPFLCFSYYVCAWNYRELKDFIHFALAHKADDIALALMDGSFIMSEDEFSEIAVHMPEHPEHRAFLESLNDPVFADPRVSVGNLLPFFPPKFFKDQQKTHRSVQSIQLEERSVDALVAALGCTPDQSLRVWSWVEEVKEIFAATMAGPAEDGGASPVQVLAQSLKNTDFAGAEPAFQARAQSAVLAGTGQSYFEAFQARLFASIDALAHGLSEEQSAWLRSLDFGVLLDMKTSNEPFMEAIAAASTPPQAQAAPPPQTVQAIAAHHGFSAGETEALVALVKEARDHFARMVVEAPAGGGKSPAQYLATLLQAKREDAQSAFLKYLAAQRPASNEATYLANLQRGEQALRQQMDTLFSNDQRKTLAQALPGPLFDWPTGYDPFGTLLKNLLEETSSTLAHSP